MPRVSPIINDFTGGEVSPFFVGRVDAEKYSKSVALCQNWIPTEQGALTRRPGTVYISDTDPVSHAAWGASRLFPFVVQYSGSAISLMLVLDTGTTPNKMAVYPVGSPTSPPGGSTNSSSAAVDNYAAADLPYIQYAQTADTIYFVCPGKAPQKYVFATATFSPVTFTDGPWLATNTTATTLTPNNVNATQLTASATTGINGGSGFATTDVGRLVRFRERWYTITTRTSSTVVQVTAGSGNTALPDTSANTDWRLGLFTTTAGGDYPGAIAFHENRMILGSYSTYANRFDGSVSGENERFSPTVQNSTSVTDAEAYNFNLSSSDGAIIRWFISDERGLLTGTQCSEFLVTGDTSGITPLSIDVKEVTTHGSAKGVAPVRLGKSILFVQPSRRKVRDLGYFFDVSGFVAYDVTRDAEHLTQPGVVRMAAQREVQPIVWACLTDGSLVGVTYTRQGNQILAAWHRHVLGGRSDASGAAPIVEDIACIPNTSTLSSTDGRDILWLIVSRKVNGSTVRWVECLAAFWDTTTHQRYAINVDAAQGFALLADILGATTGTGTVTFNVAAHGLSVGSHVTVVDVVGLTEVNDRYWTVSAVPDANHFTVSGWTGSGAYVSGGGIYLSLSGATGVDQFKGETVSVLGDGAAQANVTVTTGGVMTLAKPAGYVTFGFPYQSDLQLLPFQAGAADGTAFGKIRRISKMAFGFFRTLGVKIGSTFTRLTQLVFAKTSDPTYMPPLYTGTKVEHVDFDWDTENGLCLRVEQPLPATVLAIAPQQSTQDPG